MTNGSARDRESTSQRRRRWWLWALVPPVVLLVVLAGLIVAARWALDSPAVVERLAQEVSKRVPAVELTRLRGTIASGLAADRVVYEDENQRIVVEAPSVRWSREAVLDLLRWGLASARAGAPPIRIAEVDAQRVEVTRKRSSPEPATLPASLESPVAVDVASLRVGEIVWVAPPSRNAISGVEGRLSVGATHELIVSRIAHEYGRLDGQLRLGARPPFALDGELTLRATAEAVGLAVVGTVSGTLERPRVSASIRAARDGAETDGTIEAELSPFGPYPLRELHAVARSLDLAQWDSKLPATRLDLIADASMTGETELTGALAVSNANPGPVDASRIPLRAVAGRFVVSPRGLRLDDAVMTTTRGDVLRGAGAVVDGKGEISLVTEGVAVEQFHRAAKPMRIAGEASARFEGDEQIFEARLRHRGYAVTASGRRRGDRIDIASADVRSPYGRAKLQGNIVVSGDRPFRVSGELAGFNPADFGDFPKANLNGNFDATGRLSPEIAARVSLALAKSTLRGEPLSGNVKVALTERRRFDGTVDLLYAGNRVRASGALGEPGDELSWQIDAPALARVDRRLRGVVNASGKVRGTFAAPAIAFEVDGQGLAVADPELSVKVAALQGSGAIDFAPGGEVRVQLSGRDIAYGDRRAARATVDATGTLGAHKLQGSAQVGESRVQLRSRGGWSADAGWKGTIEQFEIDGPVTVALVSPAPLELAPGRVLFGPAAIESAEARMEVQRLSLEAGELRTTGRLDHLYLARFLRRFAAEGDVETTLVFGGAWDLTIGRDLTGVVYVVRESGDVMAAEDPELAVGLRELALTAAATGNGIVDVTLAANGEKIGTVDGKAQIRFARSNGGWAIGSDAPVTLALTGALRDIGWVNSFLPGDYRVGGTATFRLNGSGTLAAPNVRGELTGDDIALRSRLTGIELSNGELKASFDGNRFVVDRFLAKGPSGTVSARGVFAFTEASEGGRLDIRADKLALISRADRKVVISGDTSVRIAGNRVEIAGDLRADEGLIQLPAATKPALGSDVVVKKPVSEPARPKSEARLPDLDLQFDFGDKFYLRGRGLDTRLAGKLRFAQEKGAITARGTVRAVEGTFFAYGRRLEIERGTIRFDGPLSEPRLNVLALRKNQEVEAGVQVTGDLIAPQVRLFSRPDVPDADKLSWLVLGHGGDRTNQGQAALLQSAALALLSPGGAGAQGGFAQLFGLDQLSVGAGDDLQSGVVSLGKRITDDIYLAVEQGVAATESFVRLNLLVGRAWSVQAKSSGSEGALDFFYTFRFD